MMQADVQPRGDRKSEIVAATLAVAFEVGPDAVSTSMISKRINVSQPAIYKHFPTKDAIWLAVSDQLARRLAENVEACRASRDTPEARLRTLVMRHIGFVQEVPALPDIMVMRQASPSHEAIRQRLQAEMANLRGLMVELVGAAQDRGVLRHDIAARDIVTLIIGIVQGLVLRMIVSRDPSSLSAEGERLYDLQIGMVAAKEVRP
jgi:AcrR family transcriptional regulator